MEINQADPKFQDMSIAPMHTVEHILNQTMIRMFGCARSRNSHIEKKKSKCDYNLKEQPTQEEITGIEKRVNDVIKANLPVTANLVSRMDVPLEVDLSKLPVDAGEMLRIVYIGDYDICACVGQHVGNTSEIGYFKILNTNYREGLLRLRFKIEER